MGKQINYYLEYEGFLKIAEAAIERGCEILKRKDGKVLRSREISFVTRDCFDYYFYYPPAGKFTTYTLPDGREFVDSGYNLSGNTLIEAGYSPILSNEKRIVRARLFVVSGYYKNSDEWVPRPDCLTKLYCALERVAKKVAPRVEKIIEAEKPDGETVTRKYIDYISPFCAELYKNGYN